MEAAELAWPNFKMSCTCFKNHSAFGPDAVDDSAVTIPSAATEVVMSNDGDRQEQLSSRLIL